MPWTDVTTFNPGDVLTAAKLNQMRANERIGHIVCTSSTRPASPDTGTMIYETDTAKLLVWNGSAWVDVYPSQPTGSLIAFAGSAAPTGWLLCDGTAVSRTTYATLFSTISTTYGAGDGSTTFGLPDMRGRAPIGAGTGTGLTARTRGQLVGSEALESHTHYEGDLRAAVGAVNGNAGWLGYEASTLSPRGPGAITNYTVYGTGFNNGYLTFNHHTRVYGTTGTPNAGSTGNVQPSIVTNFIIKT